MKRVLAAVLLCVALSGAAGSTASAEGGGSFALEKQPMTVTGSSGGAHGLHITAAGLSGEIGCESSLHATPPPLATVEDLHATPNFAKCVVTGTGSEVPIHEWGCTFTFRVAKATTNETEQTVFLGCPTGFNMVITRSDCTIVVPPQTFTGVTYTQATSFGKAALTIDFNSTLAFRYEAGACAFLGTNQTGTLKGSLTLRGNDQNNGNAAGVNVDWNSELGHFVSGAESPTITGTESAEHHLDFIAESLGGEIGCKKSTYSLSSTSETAQVTTVYPTYAECSTTGGSEVAIGFSGCGYRFDAAAGTGSETEQKADLVCPTANPVSILHQNCWLAVFPQKDIGKITYTTVEENGDHAITLDVNAEFAVHGLSGACALLGTNQTGTLKGSVLVKAFSASEQVDLTAT